MGRSSSAMLKRKKPVGGDHSPSKKPKVSHLKPSAVGKKKHANGQSKSPNQNKWLVDHISNPQITKKHRRQHAKELADTRKRKRKRHYILEQELTVSWEKMRCRNLGREDRLKIITESLSKMKGKMAEIAASHVSSRVLQTCIKYCSQDERDTIFTEVRPHFLTLSRNAYSVHLLKKILDTASKEQLAQFISSLHGHIAALLRHMVGSSVVEHAFHLGSAAQKQQMLMQLYSTEFQLFKDQITPVEIRLLDLIPKLGLQRASVCRHISSIVQPILEKGIVDHSILHRLLIEYLTIADKDSAEEVVKQLSGPLLVRMIHTKEGCRLGILCVKHGSAKERKKIVKGMKGHVAKIAVDRHGSVVLAAVLASVDDTKLVAKIILKEIKKSASDLVSDKNALRPLIRLLHPDSTRCFTPDDAVSLSLSIPSLSSPDGADAGKKDPAIRRRELLVGSGLADALVDLCKESPHLFLMSKSAKEIIYALACDGAGGLVAEEKVAELHAAIAATAGPSSLSGEHVLENFYSSRVIRKLVLSSPSFASVLWRISLCGRCSDWMSGHGRKVVLAYMENPDESVRRLIEPDLLILAGLGK